MDSDEVVLAVAAKFLRDEVAPHAQDIDRDVEAVRRALHGMCDRQLMALRRPAEFGGPGISEASFRTFQQEVARASGTLAFLQTQHQSAVSMIAKSDNKELKDAYLPHMADGKKLVGIGFSQLRRTGDPIMRATPVEGGYELSGTVPWITGWTFYPEFLIGATLPDGRAVFAVVPLETTFHNGTVPETTKGPVEGRSMYIRISPPMKLAAMEAAMTVSAEFDGYFVPDSKVAFIKESGWIRNNDLINIALQGHFALGCAQAGLDILREVGERKGLAFVSSTYDALEKELMACNQETTEAQMSANEEATEERLKVRAWAIDLAVRCAHAAVTASSGAANALSHPAQRVYREALVYTVSAQTAAIMEATLDRLVR